MTAGATAPAAQGAVPPPAAAPVEGCPLCGAPLAPDQEWCLNCGAAARTRLAATPNWQGPAVALAVVALLALAVLAAAIIKLVGDSGPVPPARTTTIVTPAAAPPAATTPTIPTPTTPAATVPTISTPAATVPPATTPAATAPGAPATGGTPTPPTKSTGR